jgi:hypothetical protein
MHRLLSNSQGKICEQRRNAVDEDSHLKPVRWAVILHLHAHKHCGIATRKRLRALDQLKHRD